jgi:hypothetical protein
VELKLAGVSVFGNPSKKDSLVLVLPDVRGAIAPDAAAPLLRGMLGGRVYVKWPYLQEAEVRKGGGWRGCGSGRVLRAPFSGPLLLVVRTVRQGSTRSDVLGTGSGRGAPLSVRAVQRAPLDEGLGVWRKRAQHARLSSCPC